MSEQAFEREHRITPLELFLDLVFVFAFTQVTTVFVDEPTWRGLAHGLLILAVLWWTWASYAWLTNTVDAGEDAVLAAVLVAMAGMFVAALAVPDVFGAHGVLFGAAFLLVAVMHLALTALAASGEPDFFGAVRRIVPTSVIGAMLILAAGFVDGTSGKSVLFLLAITVGYLGPLLLRTEGWRLAPEHFVERHGLIVLIAIGESLFATGLGARSTDLDAGVVTAAVLGLVVATSFWLAYFDFFPVRLLQLLSERSGTAKVALARDVYSYIHLPMVAGIVLFAFAMEVTLAHVGEPPRHGARVRPLHGHRPVSLRLRGAASACLSDAGSRPGHRHPRMRGAVPSRPGRAALVPLALVAAVWVALHAYEIIWWQEARAEARGLRVPASTA